MTRRSLAYGRSNSPDLMPGFRKLGLVYSPDGSREWARQAAMLPTPLMLDEHRLRVYFASTDAMNIGRIGYVELDVRDPTRILDEAKEPVLDIGRPGAFDDNGVNPSSIVRVGDRLRLYYVGYQLHRQVPYTLFTGLAESSDGGKSFHRYSEAPILDRCDGELFFRTAPFVQRDENGWKLLYIGGSDWTAVDGRSKPIYGLRAIRSDDGLRFPGKGNELMAPRLPDEIGFGRPFVRSTPSKFELFYSVRTPKTYRLGYARSRDGSNWERADHDLRFSGAVQDWETEMTCYAVVVDTKFGVLMLYNGNGYGRTGFGIAVLESA